MDLTISPISNNFAANRQNSVKNSKSIRFGEKMFTRELTEGERSLMLRLAKACKENFKGAKNIKVADVTPEFSEPIFRVSSDSGVEVFCHTSKFSETPMLVVNSQGKSHLVGYGQRVSSPAKPGWLKKALCAVMPKY